MNNKQIFGLDRAVAVAESFEHLQNMVISKALILEVNNRIIELEEENERLRKEAEQRKHIFVGYTNGYQIQYAKEDEGCFYPDTDNDCYIPLYMLEVHKHRAVTFGPSDEAANND